MVAKHQVAVQVVVVVVGRVRLVVRMAQVAHMPQEALVVLVYHLTQQELQCLEVVVVVVEVTLLLQIRLH